MFLYDSKDTYEKSMKRREKKAKDALLMRMGQSEDKEEVDTDIEARRIW